PLETIISDVAFSSDGTLYASAPQTGDLYSIDPITGAKTLLFNTGITQLSGLAAAPASPTPTPWGLPAVGDFNGDSKPDYVLYKSNRRQTAVWFMNNHVFVSGAYGPTLSVGWTLAGVADFNGDGKLDYLLFNPSTRQSAIWYLSGVTFLGGAYGPTLP